MPAEWEEGLLRVAQESLTNTIKHAKAKNCFSAFAKCMRAERSCRPPLRQNLRNDYPRKN